MPKAIGLMVLFGAICLLPVEMRGDRPLRPPSTFRADAPGGRFYAEANHETQRTTVFEVKAAAAVPRYEIPAWSRVVHLSADGRFVAFGYSGSNLLSLGVTSELAMITFYQDGAQTAQVPLRRLMPDLKLLRRSASHWVWGEYLGFQPHGAFRVKTVDGRILTLDPATGNILP